ncbi:cyclic lactone autoinducer peptide [Mobilisporobacter senegalensis]|uniref:Cyclic lactone autoinducer peptide n=1 Tax=Mobilisporobacter senegalensis TaxID=1329262 RepID=A0A3N1X3I9_9FIRM|nr:cyclic lactone autoinducer peptide [Mobilisporobacter senegalensis]ROR21354.1 cyclic lactone autoinducer peptide [Mobilisporobacter senegalensis]
MKRRKLGNLLAVLSLVVATVSANQVCYWWFNQPKFPEKAKRLRKF